MLQCAGLTVGLVRIFRMTTARPGAAPGPFPCRLCRRGGPLSNLAYRRHRRHLRHHRRIRVDARIRTHHLSRGRSLQAILPCNAVNPLRGSQLRLGQAELPVLLLHLLHLLLFRLNTITVFDAGKMLPAIDHDQQKQRRHGTGKTAHFLDALRIGGLHQPRIVKPLDKEDLRRRPPARPLLLRHQGQVPLGGHGLHAPAPACDDCLCCDDLCRHCSSPNPTTKPLIVLQQSVGSTHGPASSASLFLPPATGPGPLFLRRDTTEVVLLYFRLVLRWDDPGPILFCSSFFAAHCPLWASTLGSSPRNTAFFSAARSFALRARGLRSISSASATTGLPA